MNNTDEKRMPEFEYLKELISRSEDKDPHGCGDSGHCWHMRGGPIWMVIPDGHVVQNCCKCPATRTKHRDHARDTCLENLFPERHRFRC